MNTNMQFSEVLLTLGLILHALVISILAQNSPVDYLLAHNAARAAIGADPLEWDEDVAAYAEGYAARRSLDCKLEHSLGPYGENIAVGPPELSGVAAVTLWVDERSNYNYFLNSCLWGQCLHYTQVVWKKSERLGCARVECPNGYAFVTCNYDPPGNYVGERPY